MRRADAPIASACVHAAHADGPRFRWRPPVQRPVTAGSGRGPDVGAARVAMVLYLGPLYSAAIGWAVLGERIEWFHAVGALLILPGIWLSTQRVGPPT